MRLQEGYLLKEIAGEYVLFPFGQNVVDYKHMLELNGTGYFITTQLLTEITYDELLKKLIAEYEATEEDLPILRRDLDIFVYQLREREILE